MGFVIASPIAHAHLNYVPKFRQCFTFDFIQPVFSCLFGFNVGAQCEIETRKYTHKHSSFIVAKIEIESSSNVSSVYTNKSIDAKCAHTHFVPKWNDTNLKNVLFCVNIDTPQPKIYIRLIWCDNNFDGLWILISHGYMNMWGLFGFWLRFRDDYVVDYKKNKMCKQANKKIWYK